MGWSEALRDFGAGWDQTRRSQQIASRTLEFADIGITSDFEGGNGFAMDRIGPDHYYVHCESDPGEHRFSGKSYYFCFGVQNRRPEARRIRIRVEASGWKYFGPQTQHFILRRGDRWRVCGAEFCRPVHADNELDMLDLDILLPAGSERDPIVAVSNFHWNRYTEFRSWLQTLPDTAERREVGTSQAGHPITAVEIGNASRPAILVALTSQPSELAGLLILRAMIDHLVQDTERARRLRENVRFCFLPVTNPDGHLLGLTVSTPGGRFPVFEGDKAARGDADAVHEAQVLWGYLARTRPAIYWEWHSNNWSRRPGQMLLRYRPELIADERRRRDWVELEDALLGLPETHHENTTSHSEGPYQPTMGFQAAVELGAMSCMIKSHEKYPIDVSISHGISCLERAAEQLMKP